MKKWIVRFVTLLVFNIVVLLIIGLLTPARVGWSALWAGIIMTVLVIWVKPLVSKWFRSMAAKSASERTRLGEKLVQALLAVAVAFVVWMGTVLFSGVSVAGWVWGWIIPPVILLIGWAVYDAIDGRVEAHAGALYDRATGGPAVDAAPAAPSEAQKLGRRELDDGLTDEQRKLFDDLG
ncbi:hypothetical protein PU630_12380 [Microbacterium horticulturae]|uniref:Phage holin family protein n=1 Tax=Microbacterium horticulturae TaxID=3028316 RepID=A0ABY8BV35_9MICO|nr:hypothetical protein [Microbacterium sp. KACC 23027]WEG08031.1 hypothetical protein PU630_12380 [Microbacterium sp. KACC 23027]